MNCKVHIQNEICKILMTTVQHLGLPSRIKGSRLANSDPENNSVSERTHLCFMENGGEYRSIEGD